MIPPGTKKEWIGTKIHLYTKKQLLIHRDIKYTGQQWRQNYEENKKINKTYRSVPEKIGTHIYGRVGDKRDEPDITPVVGK